MLLLDKRKHSMKFVTLVAELNALKKSPRCLSHRRKMATYLNTHYIVSNGQSNTVSARNKNHKPEKKTAKDD
jgi:hypothetical protein